MRLDHASGKKKIEDVAAKFKDRQLPVIHEGAGIREIVEAMIKFGHSRVLYVVDDDGKLLGTLSLSVLVRHVFSRSHEPRIHPRRLMKAITSETAGDMLQKHPVVSRKGEEIKAVVDRMVESNMDEIPIVDEDGRIVDDITMLDLLEFILVQKEP